MFEIQSIFLLPCIVLLDTVATYPFICPSPAHWHLRSILECQSEVNYTCLFNNSDDSYVEKCRRPGDIDVIRKGYKLIWSGSLNQGDCSFDRFQPINFRTKGSSSCIYLKSRCNEEGQVLANNGSGLKDAYCSCDSNRGYYFLHMPTSKDFCIPSEEDCTCYTNGSMLINNIDQTGFLLDNTPIGSSTSNRDKIRKLIVKDRRIVMYLALVLLALLLSLGPVILILYLLPLWRRQIILCIRLTQGVIRECCRAEQSSNGASTDDLVSKDEGTTNDIQEFEQHPKLQNRSSIEQPKNTDVDGTTNPEFEMDNDFPKPDSTIEKEHFTVVTEVQAPAKSVPTDKDGYSLEGESIQDRNVGLETGYETHHTTLDDIEETKDGETPNIVNRSLEVDVHTDQDGYFVEGESIQEGNMGSDTKYETLPTEEDRESSSVLDINNQPTQKDNQKIVGCSFINESTVDTNSVSNETSDGLIEEDESEQHQKLQNYSSIELPKNTNEDGTTNPEFVQTEEDRELSSILDIDNQPTQKDNQKMVRCSSINESTMDWKRVSNETSDGLLEEDENRKDAQQPIKSEESVACSEPHTGTENPEDARLPTKLKNPVACSESHFGTESKVVQPRMEKSIIRIRQPEDDIENKTLPGKQEVSDLEFKDRQKVKRDFWEGMDKHFYYETEATSKIWKRMQGNDELLVIGPPSSGKAVTAAHLGLQFSRKGYELHFLILPEEMNTLLKVNTKQAFVIQRPFGNQSVSEESLGKWDYFSKQIKNARIKGNTKIIMTVRTRLYNAIKSRLNDTVFGKNQLDLSQDCAFTAGDRQGILEKHMQNQRYPKFEEKILNETNDPIFLMWCNIISTNQNRNDECWMGPDPYTVIKNDIDSLQRDCSTQFSCLVLSVLHDGTFNINQLSECLSSDMNDNNKVKIILASCGITLESHENMKDLRQCFETLTSTYLHKYPTMSEYSVLNDNFTKAVIEIYGPGNLGVILKYASSKFIREYIRSNPCPDSETNPFVVVPNDYHQRLAKRLIDDLRNGRISDVFSNPSFRDETFVKEKIQKELEGLVADDILGIMIRKPSHSGEPKTLIAATQYATPVHWLCKLGLKELLVTVCNKCPLKEFIKTDPGDYKPLHFAAGNGHLNVVKYLVEDLGVDVRGGGTEESPFDLAQQNKKGDVENYLFEKGAYELRNTSRPRVTPSDLNSVTIT